MKWFLCIYGCVPLALSGIKTDQNGLTDVRDRERERTRQEEDAPPFLP